MSEVKMCRHGHPQVGDNVGHQVAHGRYQAPGRVWRFCRPCANARAHAYYDKVPIPAGAAVLHRCDRPACVNPAHLFLGTQRDNIADMNAKGRQRGGGRIGESNAASKITEADVRAIRAASEAARVVAARFGICAAEVCAIRRGARWAHVQ